MKQTYKSSPRFINALSMMLAKAKISENVFPNNLPTTIGTDWEDMIVYETDFIADYDSNAVATVEIRLYAKEQDGGISMPVKKLNSMTIALCKAIDEYHNSHYVMEHNGQELKYNADIGFYYNVVNVSVTAR